MKKLTGLIPRLLGILVFVITTGVTLAMAYIMFAPDTLPKPFYLVYEYPDSKNPAESTGSVKKPSGNITKAQAAPETIPTAAAEIKPGQGIMIDTGAKIVNLVDPTGRKLLRVGIVLEFTPHDLHYFDMPVEERNTYLTTFKEEINLKLPVINDILITQLSSKSFESIYTAEGKENLRQEILDSINKQLPENEVIFVYFTEFVVQ